LLDNWLDLLPEETPVTLIIESCYSGNFITPPLLDSNRTIITSASAERQAKIMRSSSFSKIFFDQISTNQTISHAFERSQQWMQRHRLHLGQNPQLEADGDGQPNQIYDHRALGQRRIPDDIVSLGSAPEFVNMSESIEIFNTAINQQLSAELLGPEIERVFATIMQPSFEPEQQIQDWQQLDQLVSEIDLTEVVSESDGNTRLYQFAFPEQKQLGEYAVIFQAENRDGSALPVKVIVQLTEGQLTGDVNGDGTVNIFDLVIAAGSFGKIGAGIMGDVNADGTVNIFDLVIVAGNFGKSLVAAAPSMVSKVKLTTEQKHHIASAIDQLESNANLSSAEEIALNVLKSILPERLPTQTQLLANYPNPFNPETWIPFQLAQDAIVTAKIYDLAGKQIRMIELGHIPAGNYVESSKAIYWDGRTEDGEKVSSGTYFYQIEAGDYTEIKKMVVLK
ncbi:MAG: FlgD immunoglobulin-like domain containing protein, partial [Candidatus Poribacteria bacterium]|nr:FlgD immunoglobulin-like domain containing protein [Candidatus Poribacteria bacterium]